MLNGFLTFLGGWLGFGSGVDMTPHICRAGPWSRRFPNDMPHRFGGGRSKPLPYREFVTKSVFPNDMPHRFGGTPTNLAFREPRRPLQL